MTARTGRRPPLLMTAHTRRRPPLLAIRRTFEVVTPESAEYGDAERRGWTDAYGAEYDEPPEPERVTFRELLDVLEGTIASCAP